MEPLKDLEHLLYKNHYYPIYFYVGKHFTCSASTLTLADLELFLVDKNSNGTIVNEVREFFEAGDAVRFFSGNQAQEQTLRDWNRALLKLVAKLSALK